MRDAAALEREAYTARESGKAAESLQRYQEAVQAYAESGDADGEMHALRHVADLQSELNLHLQAWVSIERVLKTYRTEGTGGLELANTLRLHGTVAMNVGHHEEAVANWREACDLYESEGIVSGVAEMTMNLALCRIN